MRNPAVIPVDRERSFGVDELFFSTTDSRGVITGYNDVFVRVSGYGGDQLRGRAHNIVRHPDMPRAVFKLLWDSLEAGRTFGGFVKNLAADGTYYWVVALVLPVPAGFLSVRLKPSSGLLATVQGIYASMLAIERQVTAESDDWRAGMAAAGEHLDRTLRAKGFAGYDDFMHTAVAAEVASRGRLIRETVGGRSKPACSAASHGYRDTYRACIAVDAHLEDLFSRVEALLTSIKALEVKSAFLHELAGTVHLVSLNTLIAACRLERGGSALSTVTQELGRLAVASTASIAEMTGQLLMLAAALRQAAFSITASKLQVEMTLFFLGELMAPDAGLTTAASRREDVATLIDSFTRTTGDLERSLPAARAALHPVRALQDQLSADLRRLSSVHIIGKVQAAGVADGGHFHSLLDSIVGQLDRARTELDELADGMARLRCDLPTFERAGVDVQRLVAAVPA